MTTKKHPTTTEIKVPAAKTPKSRAHTLRMLGVEDFGDLDVMFGHDQDAPNRLYFRESGDDYATFILNTRQANALLEWLQGIVPLMVDEPMDPTAPVVRVVA